MQVKKFVASSVIEALQQVKRDLGPDAIILSTQEDRSAIGRGSQYIVVAAVSEYQLKKKELAEKKLGSIYADKVVQRTALQQKAVIDNIYNSLEKKAELKNRKITQTRYIDIDGSEDQESITEVEPIEAKASSAERVKSAAQEAFKTSLTADFFGRKKKEAPKIIENVLPQRSEAFIVKEPSEKFSPHIVAMAQKLKICGVNESIIQTLTKRAQKELGDHSERKAIVDSWFAKWILNAVEVKENEVDKSVEIFIGPQGSGKTTTLLKVATNYVVQQRKSVAIVTSDINKVGAIEQLRVYSRILNIPVYMAKDANDLQQKIYELEEYDSVLIDTPGISLRNMEELDFMRSLTGLQSHKQKQVHLTISALTKGDDLGSVIKRFRVAEFDDVVVSSIDQTSQHGILLNILEIMTIPFHSFGIGSDIVDGFEYASRERVLDLIFKLTKFNGDKAHGDTI